MLTLIAVNKYGEEIKKNCVLSTIYQEIHFEYKGTYHTVQYKQSRKGNYFTLKGTRYYFKIYDTFTDEWIIDCDCF